MILTEALFMQKVFEDGDKTIITFILSFIDKEEVIRNKLDEEEEAVGEKDFAENGDCLLNEEDKEDDLPLLV